MLKVRNKLVRLFWVVIVLITLMNQMPEAKASECVTVTCDSGGG